MSMIRTAIGFIVAPPLGAIAALFYLQGPESLQLPFVPLAIFWSWFSAFVVGFPLYFVLRSFGLISLGYSLIGGFFSAALPWFLLSLSRSGYSQISPVVVTQNGRYTPEGLWLTAEYVAAMGFCGALSGAVFWYIAGRFLIGRSN